MDLEINDNKERDRETERGVKEFTCAIVSKETKEIEETKKQNKAER